MSKFTNDLRAALIQAKEGKDISREAGTGVWANYVRSTCFAEDHRNVEEFEGCHKKLVEHLNEMRELSKEEKNSLRSAKCVVSKAIQNGVDVWLRDADGTVTFTNGEPTPKGKTELQDAKTDFQRIMASIEGAQKKWDSETREAFTAVEMADIFGALALLTDSVMSARGTTE